MKVSKIKSHAKINLSLGILGKLKSKLHRIERLISFIDLHDEIIIKKTNREKHKVVFCGKFSKKIPMHWGSHPFSLVNDLKDRLMSPINYRYKKNELHLTIEEIGFKHINIIQKSSGLYIFCKK